MRLKALAAASLAAASLSAIPAAALAEEGSDAAVEEEASPWTGEIAAGIEMKRGNTRSNSYSSNINAERDSHYWRHTFKAEATNEEQYDDNKKAYERSAERYFGSYKLDRKLGYDSPNYLFNIGTYEKDNFSGFQYQWSYALGLGRRFIDNEKHTLDGEAGPGYRQSCVEPQDGYRHCDDKEEQGILRVAMKYRWQISESARFTEEISSEIGTDSTSSRAESVLTSKINASFSLRVRHLVTHESKVPAGKKEADHEFSVGLAYTF
ncbi:MAG: DUF481 domain-containing protein [Alcanivoracaceae bacterium]|jgi:putative salt-induced outer membrane protein YdiY|nr:DUF481 domain-containing protein [Alcanivoracaceae bacterium]